MEIIVNHNEELNIKLIGRLDTTTSSLLDQKLKEEKIDEAKIVLDFSELEYISSAGLRIILALKKSLDKDGKELEIHNINAVVKEVFEVTGFINILNIK